MDLGTAYIEDIVAQFQFLKKLAEKAIARLDDRELFHALDGESNSVAVIMRHVGGNLRSRWTAFLTSDGEKPDRNRDTEFEQPADRAGLMAVWEGGWRALFDNLGSLKADDLLNTVHIRGEAHSVVKAVNRSLQHTAYHVGQIVFLAKHLKSDAWESLSIPRGQSSAFNDKTARRSPT
ncbi:MAG TPA: DUF1572 family protein [Vicinamibacterales bacterium]|nr:DUF1572 family protein [Vicinamibacterales bacterium]